MSRTHAATPDQAVARPDEDLGFWDLVCADDDWLRAEFDAIVAAEYPDRCGSGRARPPVPRRPGFPSREPWSDPGTVRPPAAAAPVAPPARQRSPPPRVHPSDPRPEEVVTSRDDLT
jgi:hypothetical protein